METFPRRNRRSIRLPGFDYARPGKYFVTLCIQNRERLSTGLRAGPFGEIRDDEMWLNDAGRIVADTWRDLPDHYPAIALDAFVVMPDHVHGIMVLLSSTSQGHGLPEIVRALKTFSARRINELRGMPGVPVWQRGYFEHIIRNDAALNRIRRYIAMNPLEWERDRENLGGYPV